MFFRQSSEQELGRTQVSPDIEAQQKKRTVSRQQQGKDEKTAKQLQKNPRTEPRSFLMPDKSLFSAGFFPCCCYIFCFYPVCGFFKKRIIVVFFRTMLVTPLRSFWPVGQDGHLKNNLFDHPLPQYILWNLLTNLHTHIGAFSYVLLNILPCITNSSLPTWTMVPYSSIYSRIQVHFLSRSGPGMYW